MPVSVIFYNSLISICVPVSLECTAQSMRVTLNTEEPFTGRLYSQTAGKDCEARGDNRTETQLTLQFDDASLARSVYVCFISITSTRQ